MIIISLLFVFLIICVAIGLTASPKKKNIDSFREKASKLEIGQNAMFIEELLGKATAISRNTEETVYKYNCNNFHVDITVKDDIITAINEY